MQFTLLKKRFIGALALVAFSSCSFATAVDKDTSDSITKKLSSLALSVKTIAPSAVDGLYEAITDRGVYYVSKDTQFLVHGNIYNLDNQMQNMTEKSLSVLRKDQLKPFEKDMIIYKAENEKYVVTAFTDTSCGYCQKLHAEMADYNKLGITIRYLAFPRGGVSPTSGTYNTMVSVWCADDPKLAMTNAKTRKKVDAKSCENNIKEQHALGLSFGVTGTPALVLEDGSLQPGYLPAPRMLQLLQQSKG